MSSKKYSFYILFFTLFFGMGCQLISPVANNNDTTIEITDIVTSTATIIPLTPTPVNTLEPIADVTWATAHPDDMPNTDAFEMPANMISITSKDMIGVEFENQQVFLVFHKGGVVTGFTVHLSNDAEREKFIATANSTTYDSDAMKNYIDVFFDAENPKLFSKDDSLQKLGDFQSNYTLIFNDKLNNKIVWNLEVIFFTRGEIGVFLLNKYYPAYEGDKILSSVAMNIDQRIEATLLSGMPVSQGVSTEVDFSWLIPKASAFETMPNIQQVDIEALEFKLDKLDNERATYDNFYAFQDTTGPKIFLGYNIILNSFDEIGAFDVLISQTEELLEGFATSSGATNLRDYLPMREIRAGDIKDGMALIGDINGQPFHFTLVMFRNQMVGNLLFVVQPPVPYEYHFHHWKFDGVINTRFIANDIDYLIDFLYLYNLPADAEAPTPGPGFQT